MPFYTLVVHDVTNSSTGGGQRDIYGLNPKTGEHLVVINTRDVIQIIAQYQQVIEKNKTL